MIRLKNINNEVVKPVQVGAGIDPSKVKGANLIPELYANVFICAKKKSGKTQVIFKLLKSKIGKDTKVYFFVSTFYKDPLYQIMGKMLKAKDIEYEVFTSLLEGKADLLKEVLDEILNGQKGEGHEDDFKDDDEPGEKSCLSFVKIDEDPLAQEGTGEKKPRKPAKLSPEIIFIFDDLSTQLRAPSISTLLKFHRHIKSLVIISSQYPNDLEPASLQQCDVLMLFKGHPVDKIRKLHKDVDLSISLPLFERLYHDATKDKYNFLYVDTRNERYRKNFNKEYKFPEDNENDIVHE